ncbi:hypothetical protein H4582DRAFT_2062909 [Lactarius indigo]|nr:hypothetical protein H4582DRAFT_2062909 [Lactarius indigo]
MGRLPKKDDRNTRLKNACAFLHEQHTLPPSQHLSIRKVAHKYGVDHTTLSRRFKGQTQDPRLAHESQQSLSHIQENIVVKWIKDLGLQGTPLSKRDLLVTIERITGGRVKPTENAVGDSIKPGFIFSGSSWFHWGWLEVDKEIVSGEQEKDDDESDSDSDSDSSDGTNLGDDDKPHADKDNSTYINSCSSIQTSSPEAVMELPPTSGSGVVNIGRHSAIPIDRAQAHPKFLHPVCRANAQKSQTTSRAMPLKSRCVTSGDGLKEFEAAIAEQGEREKKKADVKAARDAAKAAKQAARDA